LKDYPRAANNPWLIVTIWTAVISATFWRPLVTLFRYALNNDNMSHILIMPLIVGWLLYIEREKLSSRCGPDFRAALLFFALAVLIGATSLWAFHLDVSFALSILSFIFMLIAGFIAIFGRSSAIRSCFSLALLVFIVPPPEAFLDRVIYSLQYGSAAVAGWIFDISGIPVLREGFVFHLPGLSIEVAQECSGIRSSIALLILALLVGHFSFAKSWKKAVFVAAGLGMMLLKNGVRIATLTILAEYVNPDFMFGKLHHRGGVVFFLFGLALLIPVYWLLKRGENVPSETVDPAAAI
jgi:exosortase